jgi:hypothetical protein
MSAISRLLHLAMVVSLFCVAGPVHAQEEDVPLGDLAREARKSKPQPQPNSPEPRVIDNDNFATVMDQAESSRLNGKPVFSIDPSGKTFTMVSPDGSCSLSFNAKAAALISSPYVASDLPQDELLKLEGPAAIRDGFLEVALHNRSGWELKEIVVGITVLQPPPESLYHPAKLEPTPEPAPGEKQPDLTVLYHLKGTGAPDSTTVFRADLGGNLGDTKEWHWAIVSARGVPPSASPASVTTPVIPTGNSTVSTPAIPQGQDAPSNPGASLPQQ